MVDGAWRRGETRREAGKRRRGKAETRWSARSCAGQKCWRVGGREEEPDAVVALKEQRRGTFKL